MVLMLSHLSVLPTWPKHGNSNTIEHIESDFEECNIGSEDKPKMIKIAKSKKKYIGLFKDFFDVFS